MPAPSTRWIVVPALLVMVGGLVACTQDPPTSSATVTRTTTQTVTTSPTAPASSPSPTTVTSTLTAPTATPVGGCTPAGGAGSRPGKPGTTAVLQRIRVGSHPGYDRVVLEFDHGPGKATVQAVDQLTQDPSGKPVQVPGTAFLQLSVQDAAARYAGGAGEPGAGVYRGAGAVRCTLPQVRGVRIVGDVEDVLTVGIGLAEPATPAVTQLSGPPRIVLDVPQTAG